MDKEKILICSKCGEKIISTLKYKFEICPTCKIIHTIAKLV
ncbi:MAG: hypothetical protein Q4B63_01780 [Clostridium perfringens]|nr:hypothetical protein [Clostridium perfringens]